MIGRTGRLPVPNCKMPPGWLACWVESRFADRLMMVSGLQATVGVPPGVVVQVGEIVMVLVGVWVTVLVGVLVGLLVAVLVGVIGVEVLVMLGVIVLVGRGLPVSVLVGVKVRVLVLVLVKVGVKVAVTCATAGRTVKIARPDKMRSDKKVLFTSNSLTHIENVFKRRH